MYDYEYENNVLLFLRLLKFLHSDQPEVLEEIIKDYPMAGDEDIEMIMNELMLTVFDEGAPDDEDDMVTVRFSHDYIDRLYAQGCKDGGLFPFRISAWQEKIKDIFDSIKPEVGKCFTNAEILCVALNKAGYPAEQYVGWLFMGDELPVHHSVVVLDDHVLDLSISLKSEDFAKLDSVTAKCKTKDDARERIAEYMLQKEQLPNYQRCIFGVVDKMYHYIGAPGTREAGIRRNKELRQSYPQHPCFQDVKNGTTRGQEILLRKK